MICHVFDLDYKITLEQHGPDDFTITYGLHIKNHLPYGQAATELGECIFHALACKGDLDNRTVQEGEDKQS
jgi:hypothetical protein